MGLAVHIAVLSFDQETWAFLQAIQHTPEENARALAFAVTDLGTPLDVALSLAEEVAQAIHTHTGIAAARRFRVAHDHWKAELLKPHWSDEEY